MQKAAQHSVSYCGTFKRVDFYIGAGHYPSYILSLLSPFLFLFSDRYMDFGVYHASLNFVD